MKDELFKSKLPSDFSFNAKVASVFDDMAARSIPNYSQVLEQIVFFLKLNLVKKASIADLGCASGNLILACLQDDYFNLAHFKAIDYSQDMLNIASKKLANFSQQIDFEQVDLKQIVFKRSYDAFIANYTLQFLPLKSRQIVLNKIYNHLNRGGIFICSEKLKIDDDLMQKYFSAYYHHFKQQMGYSQAEIDYKAQALAKVLIPKTLEENIQDFQKAGFKSVEVFNKQALFASFIMIKDA